MTYIEKKPYTTEKVGVSVNPSTIEELDKYDPIYIRVTDKTHSHGHTDAYNTFSTEEARTIAKALNDAADQFDKLVAEQKTSIKAGDHVHIVRKPEYSVPFDVTLSVGDGDHGGLVVVFPFGHQEPLRTFTASDGIYTVEKVNN